MEPQAQALSLKDIHLPDAISFWPPAIGWWLLALTVILFCLFLVWWYKVVTRKTAVKDAKKQLLKIKQNTSTTDIEQLAALSSLFRRVAISISPRQETAGLTGQSWLTYLDSTVKGTPFTQGVGQSLADAHYQKQTDTQLHIPQLIQLCENWLKAQKENKQ